MNYRTEAELRSVFIKSSQNLRQAIKIIDKAHFGIGIIVDENDIIKGILTDQDIRRLILNSIDLDESVIKYINENPLLVFKDSITKKQIKSIFIEKGFSQIPIVDKNKKVIDFILKSDLLKNKNNNIECKPIDTSVVIMAGGRGTRMEPFTSILPKPLLPIKNKSMLEIIMKDYSQYKISNFCLSVNYKANLIKAYLNDLDLGYNISYIEEDKPLGTAGSLKLLDSIFFDKPFFISNCDILIKEDYSKIYDFHLNGNYEITLVACNRHHELPYGVCDIEKGGSLKKIIEKPSYNFLVNTGMYVVNPSALNLIPENKFFHITHLIEKIKSNGKKVGVFPVSERSWIDVGQWDKYNDTINKLR